MPPWSCPGFGALSSTRAGMGGGSTASLRDRRAVGGCVHLRRPSPGPRRQDHLDVPASSVSSTENRKSHMPGRSA